MLVLSRSIGQMVVITTPAGTIRVTPLRCQSGSVRLGFEAPPEVTIHREEVVADIAANGLRTFNGE